MADSEARNDAKSSENVESDEEVFHETYFYDSDYIPSEDSHLNKTSENIRNIAAILESNFSESNLPQCSKIKTCCSTYNIKELE